jgi:hypothetical protein
MTSEVEGLISEKLQRFLALIFESKVGKYITDYTKN